MATYEGPATLVEEDGTEHPVEVVIRVQRPSQGAVGSWTGNIMSDLDAFDLMGDTQRLRMPDGEEGDVIITRSTRGTSGMFVAFRGSGRPPL